MFLDRDGVINEVLTDRVKFVNKPGDLFFLEGVGPAIKQFNDLGFKVFVITNQGGIGLGYMTSAQLEHIHKAMVDRLAQFGAHIDDIALCPHKPHAGCACRKPKPKMIEDLAERHNVDLSKSWMVGDRDVDIQAGKKAGTGTILVGDRNDSKDKVEADLSFPDLAAVAEWFAAEQHS